MTNQQLVSERNLIRQNPSLVQTIFTFSDLNNTIPGYSDAKLKSALKYAVKKIDRLPILAFTFTVKLKMKGY